MNRTGARASVALALAALTAAAAPRAYGASITIDRSAARYYAPETGGAARPRFVSRRLLAFEARLEALNEGASPTGGYDDRFVRDALDRHIAEDMLAALEVQAGVEPANLADRTDDQRLTLVERVGGPDALKRTMAAEGIEEPELDELMRQRARAADYVDRALAPVLHPTDEQLREVQRTSANPFKQVPFDTARPALARWFIEERLRLAETTFLQAARARVHVVVLSDEAAKR